MVPAFTFIYLIAQRNEFLWIFGLLVGKNETLDNITLGFKTDIILLFSSVLITKLITD